MRLILSIFAFLLLNFISAQPLIADQTPGTVVSIQPVNQHFSTADLNSCCDTVVPPTAIQIADAYLNWTPEPISQTEMIYRSYGYLKATVKSVHDGDSYRVQFENGRTETIRLLGVDAPEIYSPYVLKTQNYGRAAGDSIRALLKGKTVWVDTLAAPSRDKYGRLLAEIYVGDIFLPLYVVEHGWAWATHVSKRKNPKINSLLRDAQAQAKKSQLGLFGVPGRAIRPDTWRKKYGVK